LVGRIAPVNSLHRNSTLNARAFPQVGYRNQNQAGNSVVQFRPGVSPASQLS
jgi:hypothetical protein